MSEKKPALGRGLQALLKPPAPSGGSIPSWNGSSPAASEYPERSSPSGIPSKEQIVQLATADIVPSPLQPPRKFSEEALNELMASIREHGMLQPLIVRKVAGKYELIAGERRFRASVLLRHKDVPAIIREASDRDVLEMALIENLQREDLNPIEEAEAFSRLSREFNLRQEDIAIKVGKSRAAISNSMRLLDLEPSVRDMLAHGTITAGHAKAVLSLKEPEEQRLMGETIVRKQLTVRDVERMVAEKVDPARASGRNGAKAKPIPPRLPGYLLHIQEQLRTHFSTNVIIHHKEEKGKIEIEYFGDDQLDRILELMRLEITE